MIKDFSFRNRASKRRSAAASPGELQYVVELWDMARTHCERVAGRADSLDVAQAIYEAVVQEHPFRLVTLRQGDEELRSTR